MTEIVKNSHVEFSTAGRAGITATRKGVVVNIARGLKGVWYEIAETGAAPGVTVKARAKLVKVAA